MTAPVSLAALFFQHLSPQVCPSPESTAAIASALEELLAAARAAWPTLELDAREFIAYLAPRVGSADVATLRALHGADLYLCCGCALCEPRALRAFEDRMLPVAAAALTRAGIAAELRDDSLQQLRMRLFVAAPGESARILGYSGRGPLVSWLRVAAVRTALNLQQGQKRYLPVAPDDELLDVLPTSPDPEFLFLKSAYRTPCRAALREAVAALPVLERTLLQLQLIDGRNIDDIGLLYKVSRATAARWLVQARKTLLGETQRRLAAHLKISLEEAANLVREVQSQLLSTLNGLFEPPPGG